jgi:hypothetical protein
MEPMKAGRSVKSFTTKRPIAKPHPQQPFQGIGDLSLGTNYQI